MTWSKQRALDSIRELGVISIVRVSSGEDAARAVEAIVKGGLNVVEITMTVPHPLRVLERVAGQMGNQALIGAGTILDPETCRAAILSGAEFIVAPSVNPKVIETAQRYSKGVIPGALSPTEIVLAWQRGADMVKIFPCEPVGGPRYIKALRSPFPHIEFVPTGGVDLKTAPQYIQAGAAAVAVGGELVNAAALREGKLETITENARRYVESIRSARQTAH
jgi:2-dehydro-3-deoxyphosphogluconate aldolase/(4S)-4-hydroxy-2-oxoglutarate aldolase